MKQMLIHLELPDDMPKDFAMAIADDYQAHINGLSPPLTPTYPYPIGPGWVCFHCGQRFLTQWFAHRHFGGVDANGDYTREKPRCQS